VSYTPAEVAAASMCYLARWRQAARLHGGLTDAVTDRIESFWHPTRCRFCGLPLEQLLVISRESLSPATARLRSEFQSLSREARLARIREAQEPPWWESFTEATLTGDEAPS